MAESEIGFWMEVNVAIRADTVMARRTDAKLLKNMNGQSHSAFHE